MPTPTPKTALAPVGTGPVDEFASLQRKRSVTAPASKTAITAAAAASGGGGAEAPGAVADATAAEPDLQLDMSQIALLSSTKNGDQTPAAAAAAAAASASAFDAQNLAQLALNGNVLAMAVSPISLRSEFQAHMSPVGQLNIVHVDTITMQKQLEEQERLERVENGEGNADGMMDDESDEGDANGDGNGNNNGNNNKHRPHWTDLFKKKANNDVKQAAQDPFFDCYYVLTASNIGESFMWTSGGTFVGQFGGKMPHRWDLLKKNTFMNRWLIDINNDAAAAAAAAAQSRRKPAKKKLSSLAYYINGNDTAGKLRPFAPSGADRPSIATRSTFEQALYDAHIARTAGQPKGAKTALEMNEEVMRLTRIVHKSNAPTSARQTNAYKEVNSHHPLIDVSSMPLPFDSPRVDRFVKNFEKGLLTKEQRKKRKTAL
mgnify:CR=1 FL=1